MWEWAKKTLQDFVVGYKSNRDGQYVVYELLDTRFRPPEVFYVGMGAPDRMYDHINEAESILKSGSMTELSCKHKRIIAIRDRGKEVKYAIIFRTDWRWEAHAVESKRIKYIGLERLTNETYGWGEEAIQKAKTAEEKSKTRPERKRRKSPTRQ